MAKWQIADFLRINLVGFVLKGFTYKKIHLNPSEKWYRIMSPDEVPRATTGRIG